MHVPHFFRLALLTSLLLTTPAYTEVLVLAGGDRLQGTITGHSGDSVTLEHSVLGTLSIPMDKIKTIDDRTPTAYFAPAPATEAGVEEEKSQPQTPAADDAPAKSPIEAEPPKKEWKGSFNLSGSYNTGTTENASLFLQLKFGRDNEVEKTSISTFYRFASADNKTNQSWYNFTLDQVWKLPTVDTKWDIFGDLQFDWSEQNSWQQRIASHLGGQYPLLTMDKKSDPDLWFDSLILNGRIGAGPRKEFAGPDTDVIAEGDFGGNLTWDFTDKHSLVASAAYLPDLVDFGLYRVDATLNWKMKLDGFDGLALQLGIQYQFQSEVAKDDKNYDLADNRRSQLRLLTRRSHRFRMRFSKRMNRASRKDSRKPKPPNHPRMPPPRPSARTRTADARIIDATSSE